MAIAWGFEQGCFRDAVHAANAYAECKRENNPKSPQAMWDAWLANVAERVAEASQDPSSDQELWQPETELVAA
jgi:hypothetical protein